MALLDDLLDHLEQTLADIDDLPASVREQVYALLDGIDALHRLALDRLGQVLDEATVERLRDDPAVAWLFDAYGVGIDQAVAAEAALEDVRPYVESHGGSLEVLAAHAGVVSVRLAGSCAGCTASAATLREGIEAALRDHMPGFVALEAEVEAGEAHPPPVGPVAVELKRR